MSENFICKSKFLPDDDYGNNDVLSGDIFS